MKAKRAYIIDSHVLVRQTLVNIIRKEKCDSFFGSSVGVKTKDILKDIQAKNPDIIFLGIAENDSEEMQIFNYLRKNDPSLPIVVITPLNKKGADAAIYCLKNGAVDFITKPVRNGRLIFAKTHFEKHVHFILQKTDSFNLQHQSSYSAENIPHQKRFKPDRSPFFERLASPVDLIVIGGCSGGVQSLFKLISSLPKQINVPIVVLQHMPKLYSKMLAYKLDKISSYSVREAKSGFPLKSGHIQVVPGGFHAVIKNEVGQKSISLHRGPKEEGARPSLNVLMRSAAQVYRDKLLGVFISGGGQDGLLGAREAADKGAQIITENRDSALLWELPKQLEDQGIATHSFPIQEIGKVIQQRANKVPIAKKFTKNKRSGNFAVTG